MSSSSRFFTFGLPILRAPFQIFTHDMTFARPPASTWELYHKLKVHPNWGYVIYRTTYSPQSDGHFSTAVKYVEASVKKSFFRECVSKNESLTGVDPAIYE